MVVARLHAVGDGVELGQLPDDQLSMPPIKTVVLVDREHEALETWQVWKFSSNNWSDSQISGRDSLLRITRSLQN